MPSDIQLLTSDAPSRNPSQPTASQDAANLVPVKVSVYKMPITIGDGFPEILRSDKEATISLHPDDVEVFLKIREAIGTAIYCEESLAELDTSQIIVTDRLVAILQDHGIKLSFGTNIVGISW